MLFRAGLAQTLTLTNTGYCYIKSMREIKSHTSLRGIAAILVAYYHVDIVASEELKARNITMLVENSFAFVDLFFILSGFIMLYVYSYFITSSPKKNDYINFYISRFSRIYPLHLATLIFMVCLFIYANGYDRLINISIIILENLFLVHSWGMSDKFIFNFPSWSVSVELFAYILFPLFAFFMRLKNGIIFLYLLAISLYLYMFIFLSTFHVEEHQSLVRGVPSFILGMLIFQLKEYTSSIKTMVLSAIQLLTLGSILLVMHYNFNEFALLVLFPILVLLLWEDRGVLANLLSHKLLVYLGVLSYSIYLLHIPVRNSMFYVIPKLEIGSSEQENSILLIILTLLATLILSIFTYNLFEKPARNTLNSLLRNKLIKR